MRQCRLALGAAAAAVAVMAVLAGPVGAAAPGNDAFANRIVETGSIAVTGDTTDATVEAGEPEHAGDEGGASVWYEWTPPANGTYAIDTGGSTFDTLLAVYRVTDQAQRDFAHLQLWATNDDADGSHATSRACFPATTDQVYEIAVDGYAGDSGPFDLNLAPKADGSPCPLRPPLLTLQPPPYPPADTSLPAPHVGDTVSAYGGVWVDEGAATHQWYRCQAESCDPIAGQTGMSYVVTARDVGTNLRIDEIEAGAVSTSYPTPAIVATPAAHAANGRIFWTSNRDGLDYDLYSMLPDGTSLQRLTNQAGLDTEPAPSPDGSKIAFVHAGRIAFMNPDGSGQVVTNLQGAFPTWSPDGSRLAYAHDGGGQFDGIDIVGADGTNDVPLFRDTLGSFYDLAWSPDGSKLAFTYKVGGNFDVVVEAADGRGGFTDLTSGSAVDDHSPTWSPDGTKIAFSRGPVFGGITDGDLYVMNADGSNQQQLVDGDQLHVVTSSAWSPDGHTILFSENDNGNSELYTIPADGSAAKSVLVGHLDRDEIPSWGAPATFALTIGRSGSGSGSVTCSPACAGTYADGATVTLTASPASGSTFDGWSGACSGTGTCTVTMLAARSVTATFGTVPPPAPPPPSGGGGGGGPSSGIPPDIHVVVTASAAAPPAVGGDLLFFVTVSSRNVGGSSDVRLDLTLPAGWTYDHSYADRGPGCVGAAPKLSCDVGFINQGTSTHVTLWGKVAQPGALTFGATAASQLEPELDPSDNTVNFTLSPPAAPPPVTTPTPAPRPAPAPPAVAGSPVVGATVRTPARRGATYRWQLCTPKGCTAIKGATKPALKLVAAYKGKSVRVAVTLDGRTTLSKKVAVRGRAASR